MMEWGETRKIGIAQWCELVKEDSAPPVSVYLEGSSMMPRIRRGTDPVTIAPLRNPLRVGDVVLLTTGEGRYVVHRIWKIKGDNIRTLGDHCGHPDSWISRDQVLGQAVCYRRNQELHRLDTRTARLWGRAWMAMFPLRRCWLRSKKILGRYVRKLLH